MKHIPFNCVAMGYDIIVPFCLEMYPTINVPSVGKVSFNLDGIGHYLCFSTLVNGLQPNEYLSFMVC